MQKNTKSKLNLAFYPRPSHKAIPLYNSGGGSNTSMSLFFQTPFVFTSLSSSYSLSQSCLVPSVLLLLPKVVYFGKTARMTMGFYGALNVMTLLGKTPSACQPHAKPMYESDYGMLIK
jgi:hypothetical protein